MREDMSSEKKCNSKKCHRKRKGMSYQKQTSRQKKYVTFRKAGTNGRALHSATARRSNRIATLFCRKGNICTSLYVRQSLQMSHYWARVALGAKTAARRSNRIATLFFLREKKRYGVLYGSATACKDGINRIRLVSTQRCNTPQHHTISATHYDNL